NPYNELAEVAAFQQSDECSRRVGEPIYNIFAVAQLSGSNPCGCLLQEVIEVRLLEFRLDEAAQGQALDQNLAHQVGQAIRRIALQSRCIVGGDESADRNACVQIQKWKYRIPDCATDILEVNIDSIGAGRRELAGELRRAMIDCRVEAELIAHECAFCRATG